MDEPTTAIVLAGGDTVDPDVVEDLPDDAFIVAADSGLDQAMGLGLEVDLLVGDMDSVSPQALAAYGEVPTEVHPTDKGHTDLELGLRAAVRMGVDRIIIVGGSGGRLDHFLANALLVSSVDFAQVDVEWLTGDARLHVVATAGVGRSAYLHPEDSCLARLDKSRKSQLLARSLRQSITDEQKGWVLRELQERPQYAPTNGLTKA